MRINRQRASSAQDETQPNSMFWKVLIIDDDEDVHQVTKLSLSHFVFVERQLEFLHAYSGAQAKEILQAHDDIAVAFVVPMRSLTALVSNSLTVSGSPSVFVISREGIVQYGLKVISPLENNR